MSNANTKHSKAIRKATTAKWQREKLERGELAQILIRADTETINNFKSILESEAAAPKPCANYTSFTKPKNSRADVPYLHHFISIKFI